MYKKTWERLKSEVRGQKTETGTMTLELVDYYKTIYYKNTEEMNLYLKIKPGTDTTSSRSIKWQIMKFVLPCTTTFYHQK